MVAPGTPSVIGPASVREDSRAIDNLGSQNPGLRVSHLRERVLDLGTRAVLISNLAGTSQATDPVGELLAGGFVRRRVFRNYRLHASRARSRDGRPVPLLRGASGPGPVESLVFQLSACNFRCWYCYVDFHLLRGSAATGSFMTPDELLRTYLAEARGREALDLSGGEPEMVPEWAYSVLQAVEAHGLRDKIPVWMDTNLSTELMWEVLADGEIEYMARFELHSRAGCLKGVDPESFAFNTRSGPNGFERQFEVVSRLIRDGFDIYLYATLTSPPGHNASAAIPRFMDRLQRIHEDLPLRTIPLSIKTFPAVAKRAPRFDRQAVLREQSATIEAWDRELIRRFSADQLQMPYEAVVIR